MELKKIIATTIRQYLKENLDLNNRDSVFAWLDENAPESIFDDDGNIASNVKQPTQQTTKPKGL